MRRLCTFLLLAPLAACVRPPPGPFEIGHGGELSKPPRHADPEVVVAAPTGLTAQFGGALARAVSVELQSYGLYAVSAPSSAPVQLSGNGNVREDGQTVEIDITWRVEGTAGPAASAALKTRGQLKNYEKADDWLVSRIAQQAAFTLAGLMGHHPTRTARSPGAVAAGAGMDDDPSDRAPPVTQLASVPAGTVNTPRPKVMVVEPAGAPSDGNHQLASGMRRALGSNRIIVIDRAAPDTFTVECSVSIAPIDDRNGQLSLTWILKDPSGKEVGKVEQSNPVPLAATRGTWAGFGDIVATAAVDGILQLLDHAVAAK